jgi:hypothetical protein
MVSAEVAPFSLRVLDKQVSKLESLIIAPDFPEVQIKQALVAAKKEVIASSFAWSSPEDLLKILQWVSIRRNCKVTKRKSLTAARLSNSSCKESTGGLIKKY